MKNIPQRVSLVVETETVLIDGITNARWKGALPGERRLCTDLKVSRWTIRAALRALDRRGIIRIEHGHPCKILARPRSRRALRGPWRVGCILPDPLWQLTSFTSYSFNQFRTQIQKMGGQLDFYHGSKWYQPNCTAVLNDLIRQNPFACWILVLSTSWMQRWFEAKGIPVIVAGSLYEGVKLPSQDMHFRAVGRHAAGMFLSRGHHKIALLTRRLNLHGVSPGNQELERGAREACAASRKSAAELVPVYHDANTADIRRALDRLLHLPNPPTAILFANSSTMLTALTYFGQIKVKIPQELSIAVIQDEAYYPHIVPELTHYEWNPESYATQLCRLVQQAMDRTIAADASVRFMPKFVPGATLSAPCRT